MRTLGQSFESPANNFTLLRLVAAVAVLYYHCYHLSIGRGSHDPLTVEMQKFLGIGLGGLAVGTFFLISGFLVAASYTNRQNIFAFAEARFLRIFPGLIIAALFCVLVVGPLATTLPISDYFSSDRTWRFLVRNATLVFGIQYDLPGVFKSNPWPKGVNGSLWTLPIEIWMYMWVTIVGALGIFKDRTVFNGVFFVSVLVYMASPETFPITNIAGGFRNPLFFVIGVFIFVNRYYLPLNFPTLIGFSLLLLLMPTTGITMAVNSVFISYAIFFIAFLPSLNAIKIDQFGDLSYGIYIYAFPVQQLTAQFIVGITPTYMLATTLPVVTMLAFMSWRFIEKPALTLKGKMPMGRRYLDPRVLNRGKLL